LDWGLLLKVLSGRKGKGNVEKIGLDLRIVGQGFDLLPVERPCG